MHFHYSATYERRTSISSHRRECANTHCANRNATCTTVTTKTTRSPATKTKLTTTSKGTNAAPQVNSNTFRRDGGRFSMRQGPAAVKTTPTRPMATKQTPSRWQPPGKASTGVKTRQNVTTTTTRQSYPATKTKAQKPEETAKAKADYEAWLKRKAYDPRKAASQNPLPGKNASSKLFGQRSVAKEENKSKFLENRSTTFHMGEDASPSEQEKILEEVCALLCCHFSIWNVFRLPRKRTAKRRTTTLK